MHENNVSIEEMIDQLEKAGWKRVSTTIWRSPNGGMYRGPYGAWKVMAGTREVPGE